MNLRRRQRRDEPDLNLTPLIDVVFLLLIFFMVTTTFVDQVGLDITLPEAEQETEEAQPRLLEIGISAEGEYFVDGSPLVNREIDTLVRALEEAREAGDVAGIVVRADADAPHRAVVRALDGAGRVGIDRVSIATKRSDDP
ncbi:MULTISPECIES: biopolymer transporter ExbD [Halorhodospira]|uniref:ExbD/TolR family protein n=1 Tax=Halorhodospira TaxID=85108 RepID=UPI001EE90321|nr:MULTISPECIES: biopolymer transporter ExbD [Halorhodospira]MCG5528083.1 biopolymer transporter ExbD [Halorhodospira halophila]MCG5537500.1 biopolymer transporter ExbD [Halorhodospira sp. 9622]MCG5543045.1 biopolymer transporter ExbD [Halorhodospira sp. 9628]